MADKPNHQKQRENADEPEPKRSKPNECENVDNTMETKKITNIYYDCLERIFDFLDLESLLMVAQTCKRLQIAAAAKFGDEFGKKRILLEPGESRSEVIVHKKYVEVFDLKLCLPFLRCFGAEISDLSVDYEQITQLKEGYIDQYINQYCADTLTGIGFYDKRQFPNKAFKKPFKNVEKVVLTWCPLRNQFTNFVNWFPILRQLEILNCSADKNAPVNVSIPHLEYLQLHIDEGDFRIENAANLLQANPQLKSLKIWWYSKLTLNTILDTIAANTLITKLKVVRNFSFPSAVNVNTDELNRFAIEHPLAEELVLEDYRLTAVVDAINFIRQMKSLKRIVFQVNDRLECDRITQELNNGWKSNVSTEGKGFYIELNR